MKQTSLLRFAPGLAAILALAVPAVLAVPPILRAAQENATGSLVLQGGTLIDGTGTPPVPDAMVVVQADRIACAGPRDACEIPEGSRILDLAGRWIIPGLVDAHVHFSQTGWVDGRPDVVDLRDRYPYQAVMAGQKSAPERYLRAYLCSGVTSVFDVGGYPWTWGLHERGETDPLSPRISAAGPLLSTIDFWLNLPAERQFIHMAGDSVVRDAIAYHAAHATDAVKIWYIMPPQPPDSARASGLVRLAGEETSRRGIPLFVHATGLWEAKDAVRAGAGLLVHSVFNEPVDDEFLGLAKEAGVLYTPTLTVWEGYRDVFQDRFDGSRYPLECVDPETQSKVGVGVIPQERLPAVASDSTFVALQRQRFQNGLENARRVFEAGIPVVVGTDAGNPGTLHGPSIYREMELLVEAGLAPMDVLVAATLNGARAMGREEELGTVLEGKLADLIVLGADPLADIRNVRSVEWVIKAGVLHARDELLPRLVPSSEGG
ncbi:MAG: amidohydrolase family protein [Gemmatimonadota bacterium]